MKIFSILDLVIDMEVSKINICFLADYRVTYWHNGLFYDSFNTPVNWGLFQPSCFLWQWLYLILSLKFCLINVIYHLSVSENLCVLLRNSLARLVWMFTSMISRTGGWRLLNLNIFLKILTPHRPIALSVSTINFFHGRY